MTNELKSIIMKNIKLLLLLILVFGTSSIYAFNSDSKKPKDKFKPMTQIIVSYSNGFSGMEGNNILYFNHNFKGHLFTEKVVSKKYSVLTIIKEKLNYKKFEKQAIKNYSYLLPEIALKE